MEQEIIKIINDISPYAEFDTETDLIDNEILDSLGIILLLTEIEKIYNIEIPLDNLEPDDFNTVGSIRHMIQRFLGVDS